MDKDFRIMKYVSDRYFNRKMGVSEIAAGLVFHGLETKERAVWRTIYELHNLGIERPRYRYEM